LSGSTSGAQPGLPAPRHAVQFLRKVATGKRVQRDRSANPEVLGEENVAVGEVRGGLRSWRGDQHEGAASLVPEFARGAEEAPAQVPLLAVLRVLILLAVPRAFPPQSPQDLMPSMTVFRTHSQSLLLFVTAGMVIVLEAGPARRALLSSPVDGRESEKTYLSSPQSCLN